MLRPSECAMEGVPNWLSGKAGMKEKDSDCLVLADGDTTYGNATEGDTCGDGSIIWTISQNYEMLSRSTTCCSSPSPTSV